MILKVNLLPDYFFERKRVKVAIVIVAILLLLEAAGFFGWASKLKAQVAQLEEQITAIQPTANESDRAASEAQQIESSIQAISQRVAFIQEVHKFNREFPRLFEETNKYTYARVAYRQLQPAGNILNINAYTRSISDMGRFLLNLQRAKHLFTAVSITGFQVGGEGGAGASGTGPTPYSPYTPGAPPGYSGYPGTPPGYPGSPYPGAYPGSPYPGASPFGQQQELIAGQPLVQLVDFTAVAQLVKPLMPPVPPFGATTTEAGYGGYPGGPTVTSPYPPGAFPPGAGAGASQGAPGGASQGAPGGASEEEGAGGIGGLGQRRLRGGE